MSGFEIAGAVLGALPILISALEHYREAAKVFDTWWKIRSEYHKCITKMTGHHICYTNSIKQLILPLKADDGEISRLMAEPNGDAWKDPQIAQQLEARLQGSYKLFLEIMQQMNGVIVELGKELGLDKPGFQKKLKGDKFRSTQNIAKSESRFGGASLEYQIERMRLSVHKSKRRELFDELQTYNDMLDKLLCGSDKVRDLQDNRDNQRKAGSGLDKILAHFREHAKKLFEALSNAWSCGCWTQHYVKLLLQHRLVPQAEFELLFLFAPDSNYPPYALWNWREVDIKMSGEATRSGIASSTSASDATGTIPASAPVYSHSPNHRNTMPSRSAIRGGSRHSSTRSAPQQAHFHALHDTGTPRISNLCVALTRQCLSSACFGFLEDDTERYYMYTPERQALQSTADIPLEQLLSDNFQPPLTRRKRYSIALNIVSSYFQLHDSGWLQSAWSKSDISFHRDPNDTNIFQLDRPYISRGFSISAPNAGALNPAISTVTSLGIVLLELCFGRPIETHPTRLIFPIGNGLTKAAFDFFAARAWLSGVSEEAGFEYAGAVEWCLLGCQKFSGGDAWKVGFIHNVIKPIENCCRCFD
ncbi:hypothetical protein AOQ84DRAFT_423587 [Glonium stellatum]|uniref:DUF7580 domain-containing protein n=1 Tax=Glonium stellatum TaxID=574774 RepID=A0A8E2F6U8_9PEZI|nr:hypothetical protein AOQ84DRAFT_423587 [Glonium stellatum]